ANDVAGKEKVQEPVSEYDQALKNVLVRMMNQEKEATEQSDNVRREFQAQCNSQSLQEKSSDDKAGDNTANDVAGKEKVQEPVSEYDQALKNVLVDVFSYTFFLVSQPQLLRWESRLQRVRMDLSYVVKVEKQKPITVQNRHHQD
nr:hypothetical protein [Tanacetum cinerariifolium]